MRQKKTGSDLDSSSKMTQKNFYTTLKSNFTNWTSDLESTPKRNTE